MFGVILIVVLLLFVGLRQPQQTSVEIYVAQTIADHSVALKFYMSTKFDLL